ncbi:hypothetical protein ACFW1A_34410 [Kitasatospora sp. NPDC058965]|uniref:hypothetical protein n=1 Tax=Kitasatospora sp. NPDC058965 TaxID=3346682 RepID=UPI0036B81230
MPRTLGRLCAALLTAVLLTAVASCTRSTPAPPPAYAAGTVIVAADGHGAVLMDPATNTFTGITADGAKAWTEKDLTTSGVTCVRACPDAVLSGAGPVGSAVPGNDLVWHIGSGRQDVAPPTADFQIVRAESASDYLAVDADSLRSVRDGRSSTAPLPAGNRQYRVSPDGTEVVLSIRSAGAGSAGDWALYTVSTAQPAAFARLVAGTTPGPVGCVSSVQHSAVTLSTPALEVDLATGQAKQVLPADFHTSLCTVSGSTLFAAAVKMGTTAVSQSVATADLATGSRLPVQFGFSGSQTLAGVGTCGLATSGGNLVAYQGGGRSDIVRRGVIDAYTVADGEAVVLTDRGALEPVHSCTADAKQR